MKTNVAVGTFECPECKGALIDNMDNRTVSCTVCCQTFRADRVAKSHGLDIDETLCMENHDEIIELEEEVQDDTIDVELHRTIYGI